MELIDNINNLLGDNLKTSVIPGAKLKIAASCFSIYAYEALKGELERVESLEFIFTSPTFVESEVTDRIRKEQREFHIPNEERERSFYGSEFEIQLKNKLTQKAIAKECADWIVRKAKFRSNKTKAPMQQFACIDSEKNNLAYMPLHGFTAVDLGYQQGNAVSNFVNKISDSSFALNYLNLFNQIWNDSEKLDDVTQRLVDHISTVYQENSPEKVYFLMLYNIFNEFLEDLSEDVLPNDLTGYKDSLIWKKLFNYQKDAATGIINKLETYNGCILADSVGLGKTFTALAVIKYYELRNKSVLILCPKKLAENWTNYNGNYVTNPFVKDRFSYDVLCHTDLQRNFGESLGIALNKVNWGNYDLVVIDESHNFRNNDALKDKETRYQKLMNRVIRSGVKTKVLMLSATPVNNRFGDLKNQLALAYEGESSHLQEKIGTSRSIEQIFKRAQKAFNEWSELPPEERTASAILNALDFDFFQVLDSVTIARSRKHIQTFYDTSDIGQFPERLKPVSIHCGITNRVDVIGFNEIFQNLTLLKLAVYTPVTYILASRLEKYEALYDTDVSIGGAAKLKQVDRELSLKRLMTINLLKRLESSVHSFRLTLESLRDNHQRTLQSIVDFQQQNNLSDSQIDDFSSNFNNIEFDEDEMPDIDEAFSTGGKIKINLADMDLIAWEHDLKADLWLIEELSGEMQKVSPVDDTKLQNLKTQIDSKLASPINPGNKKVLIFTAFSDTANYLYEHLSHHFSIHRKLHTGIVTGSSSPRSTLNKTYDFQSLLTLFSPRSKEKVAILPSELGELDILIGTDCISEGQNLQDCDYLINYDIHWNPVRIIQRFGRIDRIGSRNKFIQLVNYWPDITLDEYINLKERVENRMVISDITATGDDNVLNSQANDVSYRKEQLRRLQDEVIEMEELKTGISITDLGLNDFRMDLLNYLKTHQELASAPNGLHAVVPADLQRGLVPGVIFTLRNRNNSININQQNRLHPYYLIYISNKGDILADQFQVKQLLDKVRAACKGQSSPIAQAYQPFNQFTQDGKRMDFYSQLLDQAIASMIERKEEKDLDSLFTSSRTSALTSTIKGLDDFELISFLVVKG